jgi:hypothetical protein
MLETTDSSRGAADPFFFADKDVCSIVLEVPNFALGQSSLACGTAR